LFYLLSISNNSFNTLLSQVHLINSEISKLSRLFYEFAILLCMTSTLTSVNGRPKDCPVWDYCTYNV